MFTDFHSHILPGVDDGSAGVEESVAMLRLEAEQGVRHVVATPHFYARHDSPDRFLKRRAEALESLQKEMEKYPDLPGISVGAEVYYFDGISDSDAVKQLTIESGHYLMVEMPHGPWTETMYRELEELYRKRGITPIIAHIDRYIAPLRTFGIPRRLEDLPVLVQANAEFFTTRATAGMAARMLKNGQIHLLGSDCHNMRSRKPNLEEAAEVISKRLGKEPFRQIQYFEQLVLQDTVSA